MKKVSVIISSYNRYKFLLNAVNSVKNQTYKNIEIIVVNDGSTEKDYYYQEIENIRLLHIEVNTKEFFGFSNLNYVRNIGLCEANGDYIAFLDDDDIWLPEKLELQFKGMKETNCQMSCTDGLIGIGEYDPTRIYKLYNREHYYKIIFDKYVQSNASFYFNTNNGEYPQIWTLDFLRIHNCITTCSVLVNRKYVEKVGLMPETKPPGEDYDYWLKLLEIGDFLYIREPCFYCDKGHGHGRNY